MTAAEHDELLEQEIEGHLGAPGPTPEEIAELFRGLKSGGLQKLLRMAEKAMDVEEEESAIMKALIDIDPDFTGDFVNFKMTDLTYADFSTQLPPIPTEFPFIELVPVEKVVQRDADDLRAMNLVLTKVAKRLQLAIKYLLSALEETDERTPTAISEALFRGLCLTGDAFSTLQVERFTTPRTRKTIAVSETDSQIPLVVQKAKKQLFFRSGAGAKRAASRSSDEEADEVESDSDKYMRPKKREEFNRMQRTFHPRRRRPRRQLGRPTNTPRYFQPRAVLKLAQRRWGPRPAPPPGPP
jgi:hypothetical protein